jgi:acetyl/propionyl-CoA carboxylase alpha subunit/acetyl-CoA carboxylase carboxyltransferase component
MTPTRLLVANRGEIALRVLRAAAEIGLPTVAVFSEDDARALHRHRADQARALRGAGPAAYLDAAQLVAAARDAGCDAVHPGYGFLAESAPFARLCLEGGLAFVGPRPEILERLGDKLAARELARNCGVPVLPATEGPTDPAQAGAFLASLGAGGAIVIKAVGGGGGRGMRVVERAGDVESAHARCRSEASAAFGNGDLYAEQLLPRARHVEVQIVGDGSGRVVHLWERECTLQRRHQKLVEIAPSPGLAAALRERLIAAALRMAEAVRFDSLGTFEFLLDAGAREAEGAFYFIEANPRLQVEHTVTEAVTGIDLVQAQLRLAGGRTLGEIGLEQARVPAPRGHAIQLRINLETVGADGAPRASGGTLSAFEPPGGPGVRVDTAAYAGYTPSTRFDSLLAKLVAHAPSNDFADAVVRAGRALAEFRIEGAPTNAGFLASLLEHPEFRAQRLYTRFVDDHAAELVARERARPPRLFVASGAGEPAEAAAPALAGARLASGDPLAVLVHGKSAQPAATRGEPAPGPQAPAVRAVAAPEGTIAVFAPLQGTIVGVEAQEGDAVRQGQPLLVMEAMKMEHVIEAPLAGFVRRIAVARGDTVFEGHPLAFVEPADVKGTARVAAAALDPDAIRPDLAEVIERHALGTDERRPDAVARRRKTRQRTARENVLDLVDPGSFVEYGPLVIAAQRRRRPLQELIERTPADGLVAGIGRVNGDVFDESRSRCIVMSYDYTVLAGTQGQKNHAKKDRMFELAEQWRLPVVFFTEGGGGRPGDTDASGVAGLDCWAFHYFGRLSGLVPLVAINSGRCFAGNAALLGCCDVVIATENSNIGMGGPAMIEGGGLGIFRPEEVGPIDVQVPSGVVDLPVADEAEAVRVARRYLSYFQGPLAAWECADQRLLRSAVPENRLRIYDVRRVIETLADTGSVLELRRGFGPGMVTALARIEGRPVGIVANNPAHLAGAIDSPGADKAARFMQLCDAFDLPILFLCDTPGIMVGPEIEKTALVRHAARMFVVGASVTVPFFTIVLRKSYGLGAQAMAGGSFKAPFFAVSWPTGEFGGMGLEGAVKLGYRDELAAVEDPAARKKLFDEMVARMYEHGKATNVASHFELDDVIDPAESRRWIASALRSAPPPPPRTGKKRPCIDTW